MMPDVLDDGFKETHSSLIDRIRQEIITLNESLAAGERANHLGANISDNVPHAQIFESIFRLVKMTREVISKPVRDACEDWLTGVDINDVVSGGKSFADAAIRHSDAIQAELYTLGIKDTNLIPFTTFNAEYYLNELKEE